MKRLTAMFLTLLLLLGSDCYYAALAAVLVFGVWGPGYDAASFVYFQF